MGRVIAIDGPSGAGKGTVSRLVSKRLGFEYLDTGALYRAVALHLCRRGLNADSSPEQIRDSLKGISVFFKDGRVFLKEGEIYSAEDVSDEIRTTEIGHYASVFSARKEVREFLLNVQRNAALHNDIVAEGRDMTTVVFPDAWMKFFIDASEQERAKRRYCQLKDRGVDITMEDAIMDVRERDKRDSNRDIAPLKRADDAIYIDTTDMGIEDVVERILEELSKNAKKD